MHLNQLNSALIRRRCPDATARIVTAGRDSRLAVYAALAFSYQDSGFTAALMDGALDAPEQMPAGSHIGHSHFRHVARNVASPLLSCRARNRAYLTTIRTAGAPPRSFYDTNPSALIAALSDDEPMSITMMRQE